ncbi:hypothetical protein FRC02_011347 [Tulasnella sp. 418]|nr:hypothetical protein FRC02_011347 [Tulasnella sp. 418]
MPTPEEIPPFHEDLSPNEASNWLKTLVATTGSFSDSGIFRLLSTKFEDGTAARKWFDQLEADVKQAWPAFEREFRTRWISIPLQEAEKESAWDKFCNHKLTYDMLFVGDRLDFDVCAAMIEVWVDEHLALAEATQRGQADLRETTFTLLPPFIQAFLGAEYDYDRYSPTVFSDLCQQIADLTPKSLKFVWLYHHKYTKKTLEVDIKGVVEKVDNLVNILSHQLSGGGLSSVPDSGAKANSGGNGSVSNSWEPCSPLTSVISIDEHSENTESQEVATPTAEQLPLPDVVHGE